MIFQDPYASLNPRMTVGDDHRRAAQDPRHGDAKASQGQVQELLELVGSTPSTPTATRTSSRAASASASASPARWRSTRADRGRRAGLGARRLDPGAGRQPARRPAGRARPDLPVHRPRPVGRAPLSDRDRGHVPRQDRRDRRRPRSSTSVRSTPTPRRCSRPSRSPTRRSPQARAHRAAGDVPSPLNPPSGCRFHPRCRYATEICSARNPKLIDHGGGHVAACHHPLHRHPRRDGCGGPPGRVALRPRRC